jgi:hypothetical protein
VPVTSKPIEIRNVYLLKQIFSLSLRHPSRINHPKKTQDTSIYLLVCNLIKDAVDNLVFTASKLSKKLVRIWKEVQVIWFKLLYRNLLGGTKTTKKNLNPYSRWCDQNWNNTPPECNSELLQYEPTCSTTNIFCRDGWTQGTQNECNLYDKQPVSCLLLEREIINEVHLWGFMFGSHKDKITVMKSEILHLIMLLRSH